MSSLTSLYTKLPLRMALYTACCALLIASIMCTLSIYVSFQQLITRQAATIQSIQSSTLPAFNLAAFDYNLSLTEQLIEGLISHPDIASATIIERSGSRLVSAEKRLNCDISRYELLLFPDAGIHISALSYNGISLGKLILEMDRCTLLNDFRSSVSNATAYALWSSLLVSLFIYVAFYYKVTRPLTRLVDQLERIDPDNLSDRDLLELNNDRNDEFGILMRRFASLLSLLQQDLEKQRSLKITTNEYSLKLEELVNKRTSALTSLNHDLQQKHLQQNQPSLHANLNTLMQLLQQPLQALTAHLDDHNLIDAQLLAQQLQKLIHDLNIIQELNPTNTSLTDINVLGGICVNEANQQDASISYICDIQDDIFINERYFRLLISSLISNAIFLSHHKELLLHIKPDEQNIIISISGKDLEITPNQLEWELLPLTSETLHLPSNLGLLLIKQLCLLLGGELNQVPFDLQGQSIQCRLPLLSRSQLLEKLQQYFEAQHIALQISDDDWNNDVQNWLNAWHIPFSVQKPDSHHIFITDQHHHDHHPDNTFVGEYHCNQWPTEAELLQALLKLSERKSRLEYPRLKVLLADDNSINRLLCQRFLKNLNIIPDIADNGLNALEKAQRKQYDIILMDCQMPVMDGFEAARKIRRGSLNRETPIIALAGLSSNSEKQNSLTAGMNDFISKPFTQDQIQTALIQWVGRHYYPDA